MMKNEIFDIESLTKEEREFFEHRKLKDKFFIGCFNKTESGYLISDIRRSDFSKIKYKPKNSKSFTITTNGSLKKNLKDGSYYKFTWVMLQSKPSYIFGVDEDENIELIKPHDIVTLLYNDIYNYPASASEKIVNTLDTLKNQLTASGKEVFIYELLQNANDYPQKISGKKQPVDVEFHITDNYLVFQHSGDYFDAKNIAAICSINDKEKTDNSEAIGYKGIGFKTVFLDNDYVLLKTGAYSFRFDYEQTKNIDDTPWQILPIWTDDDEVDDEVLDVMDNADKKFRVQIALRPTEADILHDRDQNYEELFADVFETERVILFIPFIRSVSVFMDGEDEPTIVKVKENDKWCVSEAKKYISDVPEELTEELNRRINKNDGKIPEKYFDFKKTSVGFACKREGNKLLPVENTCLYCYLPAKKAKWGFGFLMNSDMIPTGPRDNVEPKEKINHVIAKIAGKQFFAWIQDLLNSKELDYDSIFSLIPNFEECKDRYEEDEDVVTFIEEFQEGFEEELEDGAIIPVEEDDQMVLKPLDEVNYDETGITCTGLMSDDEVREYTEWSDFFPHKDLRDYENQCLKPGIDAFMRTYVLKNYTLDFSYILDTCENDAFQEWLSNADNNNAFLEFLMNKEQIVKFKNKEIFMTEDEELNAASSIYEDIDEVYPDLVAFNDYLPRLAKVTRNYFKDNVDWDDVKKDLFKTFDADDFVDHELRAKNNIEDTKQRLREKQASLGFFNFLAEHVGYTNAYKEFPVLSFVDDEFIDDFKGNIYFYSKEGEELYNAEWTDEGWVNLISEEYSDAVKEYFKKEFDVPDFSIESFFEDVILTKEAREYLNELGQEHIAFVKYCFEHRESLGDNKLTDYSLWTYDKEGENEHILSEDVIFFQNDLLDEYQGKTWIENGWMYRLDEEYLEDVEDMEAFCQFLSDKFGVLTFNMETFYDKVVSEHITDICENVGGTESDKDTDESIDILTYLGENYKLIFEENGSEKFISLPLYRYDTWDAITDRDIPVYLHNTELESLLDANWMPEDVAYMLEERYNEVFSKYPQLMKKLGISKYSFKLYKESLLSDVDSLADSTSEKEQNVEFHRFMFSNMDDLTKSDYKALKSIGIFAIDKDGEEDNHSLDDALYLADRYMEAGRGVETMVKKYDETACFISDAYISEDAEEEDVEAWRDYFVNLGARYNIRDIVFTSIVPNLSDIMNKDIVSLLADYYDDFHAEGVWDEVKSDLCNLNVLTKGGEDDFRPIGEVLFNDCYDSDPYPYIVIEDEISDSYRNASPEVMRLLREIVKEAESRSFSTLDEWKQEKLEWYLYLQENDFDSIKPIHTRFIQDLAKDYILHSELYTRSKVREIQLKGKDDEFYSPKELTEGSAYKPRCDFERFDIPLMYLSECYLPFENPDARVFRRLFTDMDVVYDIHEEHLTLMKDSYDFTIYFWTEYLIQFANRTHITSLGIEELNKYATIPTENANSTEVKKPSQLYHQSLIQDGFVKGMVKGYEDKMPLESIFSTKEVKNDILGKLNFATTLSFCDCLDCLLHTKNKEKRKSILFWLASKNAIDEDAVEDYLEHENSIWRNGRGEFARLNELYVIDIDEERLKQLFGKNAKVMSLEYFDSAYVFRQFCEIFNIDALTQDDFELTPEIIEEPTTEEMRMKLRLPLLIIAAVSDPSNWKELYDDYCEKLDVLQFHRCKTITLNYEGELKDESIQYHKDGAELFYVKDWMGRRVFKDFTADLMDYLDIDMDTNVLEGIFEADEDNQSDIIDHYVSYELSSDNDFMRILEDLNKDIAMGVQIVDRSDEEDLVDNSSDFGKKTREELKDLDDEHQTYDEDDSELRDEDEEELQDEDEYDDDNAEDEDEDETLSVGDEDSDSSEPEDEDEKADDEELLDDGEDLDDEPEDSEPRKPYTSHAADDTPSGDGHAYNHLSGNNGEPRSSRGQDTGGSSRPDYQPKHKEPSSERHYNENRQWSERQNSGKRRNYMGYNPDETSHRQFNVGKQEATTLETREATEDEISRLSSLLGRAFDRDSIVDENYLVRMRFYNSVKNKIGEPNMSEKEFITKGRKYLQTKTGKYVHRCSARGGILYVSPSIWNRVKYENCIICMYYGKKANQFLYIRSQKELMDMIDKDAILVQVTGNDKGRFVNKVYDSHFPGMDGNIYTMIRTIKTHGDDFIFEPTDTSNKNDNEFDPDLV
mgnify:CR=1 FL=1